MSTANAAATNGAVKNQPAAETPKPATVKALPAPKPKPEEPDLKPLEDRIFRLDQLQVLHDKYKRLQRSLYRLNTFVLEADNETAAFTFRDDNRVEFSTHNKEIIPDMLEFLKKRITAKIKEIEPQLNW